MNLVTIIVPVYNGESKISNMIESLLKQSYQNLEILIVNDGSQDNTEKICQKFMKNDKRVRILSKDNGGVSSARNLGLENSRGDVICFADVDDEVESRWIDAMLTAMEKNRAELVICGYEKFNSNLNEKIKIGENGLWNREEALEACFDTLGGFLWNKMFKKEIIQEYNIRFHTSVHECEDLMFVCEYLMYSRKIVSISNILYKYDVSGGNKRSKEKQKSRLVAIEYLIELLRKNNCTLKYIEELVAEYIVKGNIYGVSFNKKQVEFTFIQGIKSLLLSKHYTLKEKIYHLYLFGRRYI